MEYPEYIKKTEVVRVQVIEFRGTVVSALEIVEFAKQSPTFESVEIYVRSNDAPIEMRIHDDTLAQSGGVADEMSAGDMMLLHSDKTLQIIDPALFALKYRATLTTEV